MYIYMYICVCVCVYECVCVIVRIYVHICIYLEPRFGSLNRFAPCMVPKSFVFNERTRHLVISADNFFGFFGRHDIFVALELFHRLLNPEKRGKRG